MSPVEVDIADAIILLLEHTKQVSILFNNYEEIWISKDKKGILYYSKDTKSWEFNVTKKDLIDVIKYCKKRA